MILLDGIKTIDLALQNPLLAAKLKDFIEKYKAPKNEQALLKGIPNDTESLSMVKLFKKYALKINGNTFRLKGRGPRSQFNSDNHYPTHYGQHITHAYSKSFALYLHNDY